MAVNKKKIQYTEPTGYFPKEIRDQFLKKQKPASTGTKKKSGTTSKKKK